MSKNIVRKALAFGSGLAIAATALVAAPAQAAAALTIAPDSGTSYRVFAGDVFTLKAYGNVDLSIGASTNLWYKVTQTAAQTVTVYDQAGLTASTNTALTADSDVSTTTVKYYDATASATTGGSKLFIDPTGTSDFTTSTVTVQAYIELDGTKGLTAGDLASNEATVYFHSAADIATLNPTITASAITAASTSVKYTVLVPGINYHQALQKIGASGSYTTFVASESARVVHTLNGTDAAQTGLAVNTLKTAFEKTVSGISASASNVVAGTLQAIRYEGDTVRATLAVTGANAAPADDVDTLTLINTAGPNLKLSSATTDYTRAVASTSWTVRKGSSFSVVAKAVDSSDNNEPQSGAVLTVKVEEDAADSVTAGTVITAGGKSFTAAANSAADYLTTTVTTNAKGLATITVTSSTGAVNNAIKVTVTAADGSTTDSDVYGWMAAEATTLAVASAPTAGVVEAVKGGTVSATLVVLDQFKQTFADADNSYRITTTLSGSDTTGVAATTYAGAPVTISWADKSAAAGALTATFAIQKLGVSSWAALTSPSVSNASQVYQVVSAAQAPSLITAIRGASGATTDVDLTTTANTVALNLEDYADETITTSGTTSKFINGVVYGANGALAKGVLVTVSAAGVGFKSGTTYASDSITLRTSATGTYEVEVFSNQSGTKTFTIASGAASKTTKVKFAAAGAGTGTAITIDAPAYVEPGSTMKIGIAVTDLFGNGVNTDGTNTAADSGADFSYSYSGAGLLVGSAPTETDATGAASASYLLGSKDSGTITVTVKYDANGDADYADYGDLVATKTITIGSAPVAAADTKVNAGSFKGYVAVYAKGYAGKRLSAKVGKDWVVVPALASNFVRVVEYTGAGYTIAVRIYIDRVLVDTITVTTK